MSVAPLEWWTFALIVPRFSRSEKAITFDEFALVVPRLSRSEWWTFTLFVPRLSRSEKAITFDECSSVRMVDIYSLRSKIV